MISCKDIDFVVGHLGKLLGWLDLVRSQEKVSTHKVSNHHAKRKRAEIVKNGEVLSIRDRQ